MFTIGRRLCAGLLFLALSTHTVLAAPSGAAALGPAHPPAITWNLAPDQIAVNCKARIAQFDASVKRIMAAKGARTFANTLLPLENAESDLNDRLVAEGFLFNMSTSKPVRDASEKCNTDQSNYFAAFSARPDVYKALADVQKSGTAKTVFDKKLLSIYLTSFVRSGAALDAAKRKEFIKLSGDLTDLGNKFSENLNNDASTITITPAQAANLPPSFVAKLKKSGADFIVDVNESTATTFLNNQKDASARKTYYLAYNNRASGNVAILEQAIGVRDRLAHLLGFQTWAAYVLADRMAQSPERVLKFEEDLDAKLLPQAGADLATLAALKAQDTGDATAKIEAWDVGYYNNALHKTKYSVDNEAIRQYFPVNIVIDRIMNLYHKILGVSFVKVQNPNTWNKDDVVSYNVFDTKTGKFVGTTYFDFFPRPGKFGHFANFPLIAARRLANGTMQPPVTAILGNWPRPAPGAPALLTHDDVVTFFHEFGHNLAALLSTAPYETLSGGFRQDFVEAPSQMLENFMWQPSVLKEVSANVTTGAPLPDDLINKIIAARYVNEAYATVGQIKLGLVDMTYHTSGPTVDTTAVWDEISKKYTPLAMAPGIHPQASFGHLFGYDAGYYSYLWALVYAQDMFTAFQKGGLENPAVGARYRKDILEPARTFEPDVEVQRFLGRPMNADAFYKQFVTSGTASVP